MAKNIDYNKGGTQKKIYSSSETEDVPCLQCGKNKKEKIHTEFGTLGIVRCKECDLIFTSPRVKNSENNYHGDISEYEKEFEYIFKGELSHHRDVNYKQEISALKDFKKKGRLLDVGCHVGRFLFLAIKAGYNGYGVDPSPSLSKLAIRRFGLKVENCHLDQSKHSFKSLDIITAIDVLEHVAEPKKFFNSCYNYLKDDGILLIKVPNGNYSILKLKLIKLLKKDIKDIDIFDSYEHVIHYTLSSFIKMASANGFKIVKTIAPKPINTPVWHKFVGQYYQYPSPWILDWKKVFLRKIFHMIGRIEILIGSQINFQPDLMVILKKNGEK